MGFRLRALALFAVLCLAAPGTRGQSAPTGLAIAGGITGRTPMEIRADRKAYFTVFAVGKGSRANPIQVISSTAPSEFVREQAKKRVRVRSLSPTELLRFANADEVVVVAIASAVRPDLARFSVDDFWATDLTLSDSIAVDGKRLVATLAEEIFPRNVPFAARVTPVELSSGPAGGAAVYSVNACGELTVTAAPSDGTVRSSNGALLPGETNARAFNPTYSAAPLTLSPGYLPAAQQQIVSGGTYAVSRLQLPGCTVFQYLPTPAPTPSPRAPAQKPDL